MAHRFAVIALIQSQVALALVEVNHDKIITEKFATFADHNEVTHFEKDLGIPALHEPLEDGKLLF